MGHPLIKITKLGWATRLKKALRIQRGASNFEVTLKIKSSPGIELDVLASSPVRKSLWRGGRKSVDRNEAGLRSLVFQSSDGTERLRAGELFAFL